MKAPAAAGLDEAAEDARRFGFSDETVAAIEEAARNGGSWAEANCTEIWPENRDSVIAFAAISSQWRVASLPNGRLHYVGLDYSAARAGLELAGIAATPGCWNGVRVMEAEAASLLNRMRG